MHCWVLCRKVCRTKQHFKIRWPDNEVLFCVTHLATQNATVHTANSYTVRLLSFRTGIMKSICLKETTLLLFSFRHTSLLTVHTDLHGRTASGWLCRSRPLQWCLMCLSRLSGCPNSSQRDAPSSVISFWEQKVTSSC